MSPEHALQSAAALPLLLVMTACDPSSQPDQAPAAEAVQAETSRGDLSRVSGSLAFMEAEHELASRSVPQLVRQLEAKRVRTVDPYYEQKKSFWALPASQVLSAGFGRPLAELGRLSLEASDGYELEIDAQRLADPAAYFAYQDAGRSKSGAQGGWDPIGAKQAHPGPLYLVWEGANKTDLEDFPRPWAIVRIRHLGSSTERHPHIRPGSGFGDDQLAEHGLAVFERRCLRCHAINQEGGRVGPELNVPRNVLEYRDEETVRAFIRNPRQFRYSAMPAHPDLSEEDLDGLVAYLKLMQRHKHDPNPAADGGTAAPGH